MSFPLTCLLVVDAVTSATAPQPITADPQSVEQLVESLGYALGTADADLLLELYWTPAWDQLTAEEVAAARVEAAAAMDNERVRAAREAGELALTVQMVGFKLTAECVEMQLVFHYADGAVEEETRRAVWREDGWRLLTDVFDTTRGT
jgi:glucan biosynthesis protein